MPPTDYTVIRRPGRKTLCIRIAPDNRVEVLAPSFLNARQIADFVAEKQAWIAAKQHYNRHVRRPYRPSSCENGETFRILGCIHRLHLVSGGDEPAIRRAGERLEVRLPDVHDATKGLQLIEDWYRTFALGYLTELCGRLAGRIGVIPASIGIKSYRSRWGSCHADGRIYFNWRIIMAPAHVVRYVAVHELCHLLHANHSKAFWRSVADHEPDYREAIEWLKINGLTLAL